jgi:hypothetical protein
VKLEELLDNLKLDDPNEIEGDQLWHFPHLINISLPIAGFWGFGEIGRAHVW